MKLLKMQQDYDDDDEDELAYAKTAVVKDDKRPAWMRTLSDSAANWLSLLPKDLITLKRTAENIKDPLYRFFEREVNLGYKILKIVRHDLNDINEICHSKRKQTNYHRSIISDLTRGIIPKSWIQYKIPTNATVLVWIQDFAQRVSQLQKVSSCVTDNGANALKSLTVWLGGLFNPEAYITATRQCVSQANSWSLEELYLDIFIGDENDMPSLDDFSFGIEKLKLQGSDCRNNQLKISPTIITDLHITRLRWLKADNKKKDGGNNVITLPIYLNATRSDILFTAEFTIEPNQEKHKFFERGVALIASNNLN